MDLTPAAIDFIALILIWLIVASLLPLIAVVIYDAVLEALK